MAVQKIVRILDYKGLIAAPFTAFKPNGHVDPEIIPKYVDFLVKQGVKGVFVNGTTGEGLSLTVQERKDIADKWVTAGRNKLELVIIQVGANSLKDAQELAAHAENIGATGIATLPPLFYKPPTLDHLVSYVKAIADCAPNLPILLYHIPSFSGVEIQISEFLPKAKAVIPMFCGAKFTSVDVRDLLKCHRLPGPHFKLLSGFDEVLLPCLASGITAAVGASYNFMAPLSLPILDAYKRGDMKKARELQQRVSDVLERIVKHGCQSIAALKAAMNILSPFDFGPPRLPLVPLSSEEVQELEKDLQKLGAKDWSHL